MKYFIIIEQIGIKSGPKKNKKQCILGFEL